jgi:hypothetical protein
LPQVREDPHVQRPPVEVDAEGGAEVARHILFKVPVQRNRAEAATALHSESQLRGTYPITFLSRLKC